MTAGRDSRTDPSDLRDRRALEDRYYLTRYGSVGDTLNHRIRLPFGAMMYCTACGYSLRTTDRHCGRCGISVEEGKHEAATAVREAANLPPSVGRSSARPSSETEGPREPVDNSIAWTLAFAPLLGTLAVVALTPIAPSLVLSAGLLTLVINIALSVADERRLKQAGALGEQGLLGWAVFLVPVYLFKRAKALGQSTAIPLVWCVCFVSALAADGLLPRFYGVPIDVAAVESEIEREILSQSGFQLSVSCPSEVMAKAGTTFQCLASGAGLSTIVDVTVQTMDWNGNYEYLWVTR
ncbi:MAG: DUF4333 domain-containing protein [Dehalococcoidia bacterium]